MGICYYKSKKKKKKMELRTHIHNLHLHHKKTKVPNPITLGMCLTMLRNSPLRGLLQFQDYLLFEPDFFKLQQLEPLFCKFYSLALPLQQQFQIGTMVRFFIISHPLLLANICFGKPSFQRKCLFDNFANKPSFCTYLDVICTVHSYYQRCKDFSTRSVWK